MSGEVKPKGTMVFRAVAGDAEDDCGNKYELATVISDNSPVVYSRQTGKVFHLPWCDIIDMAVKAGVDQKDSQPKSSTES